MNGKRFKIAFIGFLRCLLVFINNLYCIPVHMVWLFVLQPLKLVSVQLYWTVEGVFFHWLLSMVGFWSYSASYHIRELGDDISKILDEKAIILFNHQSTSDVPLIMAAFNSRKGLLRNILWIMDRVFKKTNFGLVSWGHGDFFISAGKEHREKSLRELSHHLKHFYLPRDRKWIVLFPEGGFLKNRKASSQRFAEKNGLPHLENVSLPRVGALKVILDEMAPSSLATPSVGVKYLVDVTVAYPGGDPLDLLSLIGGWRPPCEIIFHYKMYDIEQIPTEEKQLTSWLYQRYYDKEKVLQEYYDTGTFPGDDCPSSFNSLVNDVPRPLTHQNDDSFSSSVTRGSCEARPLLTQTSSGESTVTQRRNRTSSEDFISSCHIPNEKSSITVDTNSKLSFSSSPLTPQSNDLSTPSNTDELADDGSPDSGFSSSQMTHGSDNEEPSKTSQSTDIYSFFAPHLTQEDMKAYYMAQYRRRNQIHHDSIEFIFRHLFYIASTTICVMLLFELKALLTTHGS